MSSQYTCRSCGAVWIGRPGSPCPVGCGGGVAKSDDGEYTRKTFQGDDDLKKGLR